MSKHTASADVTALPSAEIIQFCQPASAVQPYRITQAMTDRMFIAVTVASQFVGLPDAHLDRVVGEMLDYRRGSVETMLGDNLSALNDLRQAGRFLSAIDARIRASVGRVLSQRGC